MQKTMERASQSITLKSMPTSRRGFFKESLSLGLLESEPSLREPRAKLFSIINDSRKINRAINRASILLLGSSGVGKSSTINHLFSTGDGIQFAKTSDTQSETRVTTEFILTADEPEYEVQDLQLSIVDSPGFNDTEGYKQDACNFYSIDRFYKEHPKLSGYYPNLIFILVQATDPRIRGANSNFSKSLRCLEQLHLVDQHCPNVVAILTWCCCIPYMNVTKWAEKMETKKKLVQDIIFQALKVTAPVVMLENNWGEYGLKVVGDFTSLPNGVLQPKNLYDACQKLLKKNTDNLGLITLNACFTKLRKKSPTLGRKTEAKDASKDPLDGEEEEFVKFFEQASKGG